MHPDDTNRTEGLTRRGLLFAVGAAVIGGAVFASKRLNLFDGAASEGALTVQEAYEQAKAGQIYLIDIRRPEEWQNTGVATPAIPLDMRRRDFEAVLQAIIADGGVRPVALICASGGRSSRMFRQLAAAGFESILDVPEGMHGSGAGPGYLQQGLPTRAPTASEISGSVV